MHLMAMAERRPIRYETISTLLHQWVEVAIYPSADGGLSVYFHDIEARKRAEEAMAAELAARGEKSRRAPRRKRGSR
jgi:hypothetical protein